MAEKLLVDPQKWLEDWEALPLWQKCATMLAILFAGLIVGFWHPWALKASLGLAMTGSFWGWCNKPRYACLIAAIGVAGMETLNGSDALYLWSALVALACFPVGIGLRHHRQEEREGSYQALE